MISGDKEIRLDIIAVLIASAIRTYGEEISRDIRILTERPAIYGQAGR